MRRHRRSDAFDAAGPGAPPAATVALRRIISGGQTGADRAALDTALAWGLAIGGWVPRGRRAEDGAIPERYAGLRETGSPVSAVRTRHNVRDSDGTLILSHGELTGGSLLTREHADRIGRPVLHLDLSALPLAAAVEAAAGWLRTHRIEILNVAGPRASRDPVIHLMTVMVLSGVLARLLTGHDATPDGE
jgi:hypothetical protein